MIRLFCVISHTMMIGSSGTLVSATHVPISETGIVISLPVYVSSLIATAIFTWTIAKYDAKRAKKITQLETKIDNLIRIHDAELAKRDGTQ